MPANELNAACAIVAAGQSLFARGLATGSSGNISVLLPDGRVLISPTNSALGALDPAGLAVIDGDGAHLAGPPPSKEWPLHLAMYRARPLSTAVIHLHATHSAAVSCMDGLDPCNCLPPLTAYQIMKFGRLPLTPWFRPGDAALAPAIEALAHEHPAMLLASHGPLVAGRDLVDAMNRIEELEETAKLFLLLRNVPTRALTPEQIAGLESAFGSANYPEKKA